MSGYNPQQRAKMRRLAKIILVCSISIFCVAAILYIWLDSLEKTNVADAAEIDAEILQSSTFILDDNTNNKTYDEAIGGEGVTTTDGTDATGGTMGGDGVTGGTGVVSGDGVTTDDSTGSTDATGGTMGGDGVTGGTGLVMGGDGLGGTGTGGTLSGGDGVGDGSTSNEPSPVTLPTITNPTVVYTGDEITFQTTGLNFFSKNRIDITTSTGLNYTSSYNFTATDAGTYTVTFHLISDSTKWYKTDDPDSTEIDQEDKVVTLKIVTPVEKPSIEDTYATYDGNAKVFDISNLDKDSVVVSTDSTNLVYNEETGKLSATEAGKYNVTLSLKEDYYVWASSADTENEFDAEALNYEILIEKYVDVPTIEDNTVTYDTNDHTFAITNLDKDYVSVTTDSTNIVYDEETGTLSAKYAGEYTVTFTLKNSDYSAWTSDDDTTNDTEAKTATVTIEKCKVEFTAEDIYYDYQGFPFYVNYPSNGTLRNTLKEYDWWSDDTYGNVLIMSIKMYQDGEAITRAVSEDNYFIKFRINNNNYIWSDGSTEKSIVLYFEDHYTQTVTGTIDGSLGGGLGGGTNGTSGAVKLNTVSPFTADSPLKWQFTNGDSETATEITYVVGANDNIQYSDSDAYTVVYDGSQFTLSIDEDELAARGLKIKEYSDQAVATNASNESYKTTVTLENIDDTYEPYTASYTIYWKIDYAKFDLSDVKWNYDGALLDADEDDFTAQLVNLPDGLVANYQTISEEDADSLTTDYRTIVTFTVDTEKFPELANYYVPTEFGSNYINEGSSFSFELDWAKAAPFVFAETPIGDDNYAVWETVLLCVGVGIIVAEIAAVVIQRKLHKKHMNTEDPFND